MSEARAEVLHRIRRALADVPDDERPQDVPVARDYSRSAPPGADPAQAAKLLAERLADYGAAVRLVPEDAVARAVADALAARGAARVVVPGGFPREWQAGLTTEGTGTPVRILSDDPRVPVSELDRTDGTVTTAATAIAETGTLVLDGGPGQGRRALTLVPDYHLCLVRAGQVVFGVPEALARLDPARPLTFVSGPSATSDIELERVEGVHGPRTLEVIVIV
ncbi:lactate utilization protein C [Streptomyces abyssalis]|uniref:Lactate utilization protein C n=2 Tax=Streptomyces abyssalis TaxID=933944 RepID=A0A1E7JLT0_9ACTN|nr:LUD domain-containing protein [Streptomyces abyssalis]OEU87407.1 lactate utilization protein C [Streptomyces abyssalis]OEU88575.1 lactate utilization protein C [Streptomyces abyssalis]